MRTFCAMPDLLRCPKRCITVAAKGMKAVSHGTSAPSSRAIPTAAISASSVRSSRSVHRSLGGLASPDPAACSAAPAARAQPSPNLRKRGRDQTLGALGRIERVQLLEHTVQGSGREHKLPWRDLRERRWR